MQSGAVRALDVDLYRRGHLITSLSRWLSLGLAALSLAFVWEDPRTQPRKALLALAAYAAFALAVQVFFGRRPRRAVRVTHDVVDALAVGLGSAFSGGLDGPLWLLLYPHAVAVSVRGGLAYALALGALDAGIVSVLTLLTPEHPLGMLHALTLLFCAFMGGTTSSYLGAIQDRLARVNSELHSKNVRLQELLSSEEGARREQETAVARHLASEHRYRRLLERIQDGVAIIVDGRIAYANEALGAMAGEAPKALQGIDFRDLVPPEDHPDLSERYERWQQTQAVSGLLETRMLTRQGAVLTISVRAGSVEYEGRRGVIATVRDITRERQLLEAVRRRGHEFESLLTLVRHIGERLDLQELLPMVARSVNRVMGTQHCLLLLCSGERLHVVAQEGLEPEVVQAFRELHVGESLSGWVIQENRLLAVEDMRNHPRLMFGDLVQAHGYRSFLGVPLRRGAEVLGSLEVVTKGETRRFGPDEQALMVAFADQAAIAIDNARLLEDARRHLQEVVTANRRLEDVDRLRREYLRNVSHEFRTPLTVIRGYAEFLRDAEGPADVREVMGVVVESCDRVIDLVDTLLEVSRVEQEGAERTLHVQELDLREVAESSVESLKTAARRKGVRVNLSFPRGALSVQGDLGLLHHVVRKLVDNAVKYSPPGAQVLVSGHCEDGAATLEVRDAGIGIPPEHVSHIFEKFYMVDGGLTRRSTGTGVGLYLVREILRLHQGTVEVTSRPGEGSLFRVRFPRAVARAALA